MPNFASLIEFYTLDKTICADRQIAYYEGYKAEMEVIDEMADEEWDDFVEWLGQSHDVLLSLSKRFHDNKFKYDAAGKAKAIEDFAERFHIVLSASFD